MRLDIGRSESDIGIFQSLEETTDFIVRVEMNGHGTFPRISPLQTDALVEKLTDMFKHPIILIRQIHFLLRLDLILLLSLQLLDLILKLTH